MAPRCESHEPLIDGQAGVSLVEIVVAMFLFAVMSVAVLPLMIGAVQVSATNRDLVAANSLANAQLSTLRSVFQNSSLNACGLLKLREGTGIKDLSAVGTLVSDNTASISVGTCPPLETSYPTTVSVTVRVFRPNSTKAVIILTSAILVTSLL